MSVCSMCVCVCLYEFGEVCVYTCVCPSVCICVRCVFLYHFLCQARCLTGPHPSDLIIPQDTGFSKMLKLYLVLACLMPVF